MLSELMLAMALSAGEADLLTRAIERYATVETYRVTIRSSHADGDEHLRYFYQRPGWVRMEFIRPHAGAVLIYDPDTQRVRLWPFGAGRFPELNLSPANPLIRSARGQRVDRSDVGALLDNIARLARGGDVASPRRTTLGGRAVEYLEVAGARGVTIAGVHRYALWLDAETLFPVQVISRDVHGNVIETVSMEGAQINVGLPSELFR